MKRLFPLFVAALAAAGLLAAWSASGSSSVKLTAKLGAKAERPAPKGAARASGLFTGTLTGSQLSWRLTFSNLTGQAVAAHVHLGRPGVPGPVAVPLCGPCRSGAHGTAKLDSRVKAALLSGGAYVNLHTAKNAAGEIRGQIAGGTGTAPAGTTTDGTSTSGGGGYDDPGGYGGYG